ncbi:conjugal transfer protein TraD [Rhizobium rhizogenes]|nr:MULTISPECIES: conjugal transfer protein TraD [Rhizobium]MDJ1636721.1 conjugal transfer protein TraD [Rhizobium rhizogenes]NTG62299.1 conjugal transfer protein TraD [Rhizobium rhizogenes]NTG81761.1 conjugal transfer protein TraD [Rhizobium rhizogenes]NTH65938.1 conjugal transfer protein TraD [Rhizobium rhizogenes]NTH97503.1 conjugal transfer protein TraD [Rhizobium rhizogenes]
MVLRAGFSAMNREFLLGGLIELARQC